ncbi:MAG: dimethyl sulfoxide reductase anchor subunit family protein [Alphaproteobacteria bacterium]
MHPAYSVIFFTVSSGIGFGMVMITGTLAVLGRVPGDGFFAVSVMAGALAAAAAGLISSSLHLGHPERAWRAFSQWRTSWLSREGVASILAFPPALVFGFGWAVQAANTASVAWAGTVAALLALATVLSTGMIYQSLTTIRAWHDPLVTPIYVVLALASGSLWLAFAARAAGYADPAISHLPFATLVGGWLLKALYWARRRSDNGGPTVATATGLGHKGERVRMLESPHTQENFVLREMGYRIARRHAARLRRVAQGLAFALPLILTEAAALAGDMLGPFATVAVFIAAVSGTAGIAIERWLFFAEARHAVTLYYGAERA